MRNRPEYGGKPRSQVLQLDRRKLLLGAAGTALASGWLSTLATSAHAAILDNHVTLTRARLDQLAASSYAIFNEGSVLPEFDGQRYAAAQDVELHRITTFTQVPETGQTLKISGLLAVPAGARGPLPVVSWQHGTIFSFSQVPSELYRAAEPGYQMTNNIDSHETLFNLHRFAANGYAVIAADYLGKGPYRGNRAEAYAVKDASTRTCIDILEAGLQGMRQLGVQPAELFLNGWSQGALNTQWLHQALQLSGIPVRASGAASPFNDLSQALDYWTGLSGFPDPEATPYPTRPLWLGLALGVILNSYEMYYGLDGLVETMIRPEYVPLIRRFVTEFDVDAEYHTLPMPENMLIEGFSDRFVSNSYSKFLHKIAENRSSYFEYNNPIRLYYGLADEAIHPVMAQRAVTAGGPLMLGIGVAGASHRGTFLASLYGDPLHLQGRQNLRDWFDSLHAG